ncbi:MAG: hypothetical protein B6229_06990 [Spirochaetaceae bacterium 4572_7]|nr:MAG: hypothetical protein B6229_06990 [Spirochaetaceae bacterium 4572_7]
MKRVAFISDIHSNLPALRATISYIRESGISEIYCLGDLIGYHSYPNQVIALLKEEGVVSIMGNHDKAIIEEAFNREKESDFVLWWNFDALTKESLEFLKQLPFSLNINIEDITVKIIHGSPEAIDEYIREGSPQADKYLKFMDTDVLISGHTHLPYIIENNGKYLLNSGSVGKPKFGKPECSYIELEVSDNIIKPQIITLPYCVKAMTDHLKAEGFPKKLIRALESGNP